jgi:uncharacterized membrane protein YagU involved in acid resistance
MPRPTVWPMVLALGMALAAAGVAMSLALLIVGVVLLLIGVAGWVGQLLPGQGHMQEPVTEPRPRAVPGTPGAVEQLRPGMPGYRLRLPEKIHPISAGVKGGLLGGLLMPIPAILWGLLSGHGPMYPINLLGGMVVPGVDQMTDAELSQFHLSLLLVATVTHAVFSLVFGLVYGVLLPTLPAIPRPLAWGGLLMPLLWTAVSFALMGIVNPVLQNGVDWPWFILSQFIFGVVAAMVVLELEQVRPLVAGIIGGVVGGALMPVPALLWSLLSGHGLWYPVNLLAGMVLPGLGGVPTEELQQFRANWFMAAVAIHATFSVAFGLIYGLMLPKLPAIPGPVAWGGLLMPLLWTAIGYGLMGDINPALQQRVDWPWFIVSQFVFGVAASLVVLRTAVIHIPPAGQGPEPVADYAAGPGEGPS